MEDDTIGRWLLNARGFAEATGTPAGQTESMPHAAIIAATDFPIDPTALTGAAPGEIYEIRTVAGLVPPAAGEDADRSFGAALEFAVRVRSVDHVVLLAHPACGLVRCLIDEDAPGAGLLMQGQFLPGWTAIAAPALSRVLQAKLADDARIRICCQEIVRVSFENLMTYPWVLDAVFDGRLRLHGWYVDPAAGAVSRFDPDSDSFVEV